MSATTSSYRLIFGITTSAMSGGILALLAALFTGCQEENYSNAYPEGSGDYQYESTPPPAHPNTRVVPDRDGEPRPPAFNTEEYERIYESPFTTAWDHPRSTFSIDVDQASYSNVRRFLTQQHRLPPPDAVRIEEMINYFSYDYPQPKGEQPFTLVTEVATCPWNPQRQLLHLGIQGRSPDYDRLPPSNLVFLVDISGSMSDANKLPLVKESLRLLVDALPPEDRIALVVYAGTAGVALPSTPASEKNRILRAIRQLRAGGATAGGQGIELAYQIAQENHIDGGNNRVILATDGDFNVGISSTGELLRLIEEKRQQDIYLTICGFGMGNYKDRQMEQISNAGNGNYFYIDRIREAERVFVRQLRANLFTIAKDVKIQVEFNPAQVQSYRLIGYENRRLAREDFDDDQKDAGELGAGHTVTALYEIIPAVPEQEASTTEPLRYQQSQLTPTAQSDELLTFRLRYKPMGSEHSQLIEQRVSQSSQQFEASSPAFRLSATVAGFGLLLRQSQYQGTLSYAKLQRWLEETQLGEDSDWDDFRQLLQTASLLKR